jgi:hypothetical protein
MIYSLRMRASLVWQLEQRARSTCMKTLRFLFTSLGLAAGFAGAQMPPAEDSRPPRVDVVNLLGLDASRAGEVDAVLLGAQQKMRVLRGELGAPTDEATRATFDAAMEAIRADTDAKLSAVLTSDEIAKLHAALPPPPPRVQAMHFKRG